MSINTLFKHLDGLANSPVMPALFIGHGSPTFVLPNNSYHDSWRKLGETLGKPQTILCVSAHWTTTTQTRVAVTPKPKLIYDFYNFPKEMYAQTYPADGASDIAKNLTNGIDSSLFDLHLDETYGLDHGTWCILKPMFPDADVPVFQLSIAMNREPEYHYQLGKALRFLRRKGVLIIGSGNIVHNLSTLNPSQPPQDWAMAFDEHAKVAIKNRDDHALIQPASLNGAAQLSINSAEHYYPLLYALGLRDEKDDVLQFNEGMMSSVGMRSVVFSQ